MDKSDLYAIYILLWLVLHEVADDAVGEGIALVIATMYGCILVYEIYKERKNR
jgi:hypothetical protein